MVIGKSAEIGDFTWRSFQSGISPITRYLKNIWTARVTQLAKLSDFDYTDRGRVTVGLYQEFSVSGRSSDRRIRLKAVTSAYFYLIRGALESVLVQGADYDGELRLWCGDL
jgi:hypothetical protein